MPHYRCRVAAEDGRLFSRTVLASSPEECRRLVEGDGFHVLSVARDWRKLELGGIRIGHRIKDRDFILFNQELVALIRSGQPILRSLEVIAGRAKNIYLRELLGRIENDVRSGKALSEAFQPFEDRFSKVYTASIMAGERSGNLQGTLGRYIQYAKVVSQTKRKVRSALAYPTVLLVFSLVLVGILVGFILPRFESFYRDFEAKLPMLTRLLMGAAMGARKFWPVLLLAAVAAALALYRLRGSASFRASVDRWKLRLPLGGEVWLDSSVALFARTLGLLLEAGISLLQSLGVAVQAVPNRYLVGRLGGLQDAIRNGESLSDSLARADAFPALALDMIRIGETSANLPGMLAEVADFHDERVRAKIDTLVSLIEPIIIIGMGLVVAAMLLSVYLPIFNIIRVTR